MTPVELGGYRFEVPELFAQHEVQQQPSCDVLDAALTATIGMKVIVFPEGGDDAVDGFFGTMLRKFEDGRFRGFDIEHMGTSFRGWLLDECASFSEHPAAFANYYGCADRGRAVCAFWYSLGDVPEDAEGIELLVLTLLVGGIAKRQS